MEATTTEQANERWIGKEVANRDVAGTIRRYGAPVHSKPNGEATTILYYSNPDFKEEGSEERFENFADRPTAAQSRDRVTHGVLAGAEIASGVSGRSYQAGTPGNVGLGAAGNFGVNPNDLTRDVKVEGVDGGETEILDPPDAPDPNVTQVMIVDEDEEDEDRISTNEQLLAGREGGTPGAVEIPELEEALGEVEGEEGTLRSEYAVDSPEKENSFAGEERSASALNSYGKDKLVSMAKERKIEVKRTDGREDLDPRIEDYVEALRTDK